MNAAEYADIAPNLSRAVNVTRFKSDAPAAVVAPPVDDSPPLKARVVEAYELLRDVEGNGGYAGIARSAGIPVRWVARLHAEMRAALAANAGPVE